MRDNKWYKGGVGCKFLQQIRIKVTAAQKFLWPYKSDAILKHEFNNFGFLLKGPNSGKSNIPE